MCTAKRLLAGLVLPSVLCLTVALALSFSVWNIGMLHVHVYAYTYFVHTCMLKYNDYYVACIYDSVTSDNPLNKVHAQLVWRLWILYRHDNLYNIDALTLNNIILHYLLYLQVEVTRVSVIAVLLIAAAANMVMVVVIAKARNRCEPVLVQFHPVRYMYMFIYMQCYI